MMKKITIEKNKEFQKNELEKSNIKQLNFSLMKKHLFSLMMAFALVVGLSASAWAQIGPIPAADQIEGSPLNPKIYLAGSTGSLSVTAEANHTYTWNFYTGSTATTVMPTTVDPVGTPVAGFDLSVNATWGATQTGATANFTWTELASGAFYATVTDLNTVTSCSTIRGFHMLLIGFDIVVYASNDAGLQLEDDDLLGCGDGTSYPAFMNSVAVDAAGTAIRTDIMNTLGTPAPSGPTNSGNLALVHGINPRTQRHYTAALIFDKPASGSLGTITVGSAKMDIAISATVAADMPAVDVASINNSNISAQEAVNNVLQTLIIPITAPTTVPAAVAAVNTNNHADYYFNFEVTVNDRWGVDLKPIATINNCRIYSDNAGATVTLGQEPKLDEANYNTSDAFTIYGKPATGIITGN